MNEIVKRPRLLSLLQLQGMGRFGLGFALLSSEHIRLIQTESVFSRYGEETLEIYGFQQPLMEGSVCLSQK
jgi:hypothetical protein